MCVFQAQKAEHLRANSLLWCDDREHLGSQVERLAVLIPVRNFEKSWCSQQEGKWYLQF